MVSPEPTPVSAYDFNQDPTDINNPVFDKEGKSEIRAIGDAYQALQIARRLERDDDGRDFERARVLAAFNGNPPYDESEILAAAQSYRFNVSFGFMEGVIGRAIVPYNDLLTDLEFIADIDADLEEVKMTILRDEFEETLDQWGRWPKFSSRLVQDLVLNGYNNAIFPSDYDPWPVFIPQKDGFVHELTLNEAQECELFIWKKNYLIHELYAKISDPETAETAGWNVGNTRKAIEHATQQDVFQRHRGGGWTAIESAIRGGTLYSSIVGGKQISTFHVFACEYTGKVSHWIVFSTKGDYTGNSGSPSDRPDALQVELFKKLDRFPSMESFMVYFDLEAGDGKWHGSRGLGRRTFNTHRAIDKLRCSILDQAFVSGLTILQAGDTASQEDLNLAVVGPFAVIPSGVEVADTTIPAISGTTFQADALLSSTIEQRVGDIVPNTTSSIRQTRKSATESKIIAERSSVISKSNLERFLAPLSHMISIILKRLLIPDSPDAYAQDFQKRLRERGFTDEDMKKVRGSQATGKIDTALGNDKLVTQELLAEFRNDPDVDQKELKRRRLSALVGPQEVQGLLIEGEDKTKLVEATRMQIEENGTMIGGLEVPVSPRDEHEIHLQVGLDWMEGQLVSQSQGNRGASLGILDMVGKHLGQHLQFIKSDKSKKQLAKIFEQRLKNVGNAIDAFEKQVLEKSKALQPPQPPQQPPVLQPGQMPVA